MMKKHLPTAACSILLGASVFSSPASALDVQISADLLMFGGATSLSISGPDGFSFESNDESIISFVSLADLGIVSDGQYTYHVKEISLGQVSMIDDPANGREQVARHKVRSISSESGTFSVVNGLIVDALEEE